MLKKGRKIMMIEYASEVLEEKNTQKIFRDGKVKSYEPDDRIYLKGKNVVFAKIISVEKVIDEERGIAEKYYLEVADIEEIIVVTDLDLYAHLYWEDWRIERSVKT